jgi:hypothetical protein
LPLPDNIGADRLSGSRITTSLARKSPGSNGRHWSAIGRQKEVAKELGVSEQILSNWLSGSRVPLLKNLFKIEAFLKKQKTKPKGKKSA